MVGGNSINDLHRFRDVVTFSADTTTGCDIGKSFSFDMTVKIIDHVDLGLHFAM